MAYDEGLAELLRNDVADIGAITEKKYVWRPLFHAGGSHALRCAFGRRHDARGQGPAG